MDSVYYHIISYHIISYHIISYHIISYHIISYHISYHIISKPKTCSYNLYNFYIYMASPQKDKSGKDVPKITVDSLGTPVVLSSFRKKEDAAETRRRKLKMKMKHSNAFKK